MLTGSWRQATSRGGRIRTARHDQPWRTSYRQCRPVPSGPRGRVAPGPSFGCIAGTCGGCRPARGRDPWTRRLCRAAAGIGQPALRRTHSPCPAAVIPVALDQSLTSKCRPGAHSAGSLKRFPSRTGAGAPRDVRPQDLSPGAFVLIPFSSGARFRGCSLDVVEGLEASHGRQLAVDGFKLFLRTLEATALELRFVGPL